MVDFLNIVGYLGSFDNVGTLFGDLIADLEMSHTFKIKLGDEDEITFAIGDSTPH